MLLVRQVWIRPSWTSKMAVQTTYEIHHFHVSAHLLHTRSRSGHLGHPRWLSKPFMNFIISICQSASCPPDLDQAILDGPGHFWISRMAALGRQARQARKARQTRQATQATQARQARRCSWSSWRANHYIRSAWEVLALNHYIRNA